MQRVQEQLQRRQPLLAVDDCSLLHLPGLFVHLREAARPTSAYAQDVAAREILNRHGAALRKDRIIEPIDFAGAELNRSYLVFASRALATWWTNYG